MKITLDTSQMLERWRLARGLVPLRGDCAITRHDGVDADSLLIADMRRWYLDLLDTAPVGLLAPEDISDDVSVNVGDDGVASLSLPENCRRVIEIRLTQWMQPAIIVSDHDARLAQLQSSPYSHGGCYRPVAVADGRRLRLYSVDPEKEVSVASCIAVVEPADGTFKLDERALPVYSPFNVNQNEQR